MSGIALGFILSAAVLLIYALSRSDQIHRAMLWLMGDLSGARYDMLNLLGCVSLALVLAVMAYWKHLDVISMGDRFSRGLGVTDRDVRVLFWVASLLAALSVSLAGVIGFVGLIVPHMMRSVFGPGHLRLVPASAVCGGLFLLVSDTIGRSLVPPFEIPVGVITGFLGGAFFLVYMVRSRGSRMNVFELHDVNAGYRGTPVLRDLSLTVGDGEFVSIIGPNGAGKSTLVKTLAGDVTPSSGVAPVQGAPPPGIPRPGCWPGSFPWSTRPRRPSPPSRCTSSSGWGGSLTRTPSCLSRTWTGKLSPVSAETTGMAGLLARPLTELSGGELQLARIAHALAQNSRVILLDEPVSHLDIQHAVMIMDILWKLNREGTTVVTVLHDINIASDYSTRIVGLKNGGVFFSGAPGGGAPVRPGGSALRHPLHRA